MGGIGMILIGMTLLRLAGALAVAMGSQPHAWSLGSLPLPATTAATRANALDWVGVTVDSAQIDAFVRAQMQRHGLPGLALALVEGDQIVYMQGYGRADATGRPVTPQTPFLLASVSKPLTAAAVMQLVESGQVDLDAPVQRYVPDFRVAEADAASQITVRHLLLHTSGLPSTACDTRADAQTLAAYVAELQSVSLDTPPGTRHSYCSGNYNLLGRLIETVSGQSFGDYMAQAVFAPLGMAQSFTSEPAAQAAGLAQGYQWFFGLQWPTHYPHNPSQLPSGSMFASAEDLGRFLIAQLNGGRYGNTQLLSAAGVAAMQVPGTERGAAGGYGFGWVIAPVGEVPAVWHDGVNANAHTLLLMQPAARRGVVLLTNSFGIVAYESAYRELEAGVARLLAGQAPAPASALSLGQLYLLIDAGLALGLAIALWPLLTLRRWHAGLLQRQRTGRLPLVRVTLRAIWEIGFALVFLAGVRVVIVTGLGAQSWYEVLTAFPDFVVWIWALGLAGLITGVSRLAVIWRTQRAAEPGRIVAAGPAFFNER